MTKLLAVETVLPEHRYAQAELSDVLVELIGASGAVERQLRRMHANSGVDRRAVALPIERYRALPDFGAANDAFLDAAVDLGAVALQRALDRAHVEPHEIDVVVTTTVTGLAVPSLEARLAERVGFRPDIVRVPLFGLGCMGGAAGIARTVDLLRAPGHQFGLLLAVELCSLTVQRDDTSPANLVASGLFGDGAGAAVLEAGRAPDPPRTLEAGRASGGPVVVASASRLYAGTGAVMGWEFGSTGLRVVLGAEVPDIVRGVVADDVAGFLAAHDLRIDEIGWWVCHPGGPKVIDALASALGLDGEQLAFTRESLRTVGNLSSVSVLHILQTTLRERPPAPGSFGLMMAMGPGFSLELVLFRAAGETPS